MKTKDFKKRLTLNKKTIANLNNGQLAQAKGGIQTISCDTCDTCETCETCYTYCPPCPPWVPTGIETDTCTQHKTCDTYLCPISDTCPAVCIM
jgi:hypothetical protein